MLTDRKNVFSNLLLKDFPLVDMVESNFGFEFLIFF